MKKLFYSILFSLLICSQVFAGISFMPGNQLRLGGPDAIGFWVTGDYGAFYVNYPNLKDRAGKTNPSVVFSARNYADAQSSGDSGVNTVYVTPDNKLNVGPGAYTELIAYTEDTDNWTGTGPWTQAVNLASTGVYTVSTNLDGPTITVAAGTATIDAGASATYNNPDQFTVTGAGTVTIQTDVADPKANLTKSSYVLPPVINNTASAVTIQLNYSDADEGIKYKIYPDKAGEICTGHIHDNTIPTPINLRAAPFTPTGDSNSGIQSNVIMRDASSTSRGVLLDCTEGKTYKLTVDYTTNAGLIIYNNNYYGTDPLLSTSGSVTFVAKYDAIYFRSTDHGTSTFSSIKLQEVCQNNGSPGLLNALDGVADGTLENSGNLVALNKYEIISTETDHFGSGVVVGDRVTGLTTALDANNTVKKISPAKGEMILKWTPMFDYSKSTSEGTIVTWADDTFRLSHDQNGSIIIYDGTTFLSTDINYQAGIEYTITTQWGAYPVYPGDLKMQITVTDGTTTWQSALSDFDGSFNPGEYLSPGWENNLWQKFGSIKVIEESAWDPPTGRWVIDGNGNYTQDSDGNFIYQ